jgi:hypothetical protein
MRAGAAGRRGGGDLAELDEHAAAVLERLADLDGVVGPGQGRGVTVRTRCRGGAASPMSRMRLATCHRSRIAAAGAAAAPAPGSREAPRGVDDDAGQHGHEEPEAGSRGQRAGRLGGLGDLAVELAGEDDPGDHAEHAGDDRAPPAACTRGCAGPQKLSEGQQQVDRDADEAAQIEVTMVTAPHLHGRDP